MNGCAPSLFAAPRVESPSPLNRQQNVKKNGHLGQAKSVYNILPDNKD